MRTLRNRDSPEAGVSCIPGVRGGRRVICKGAELSTTSICPEIHAHRAGLRFPEVVFSLLSQPCRCPPLQRRRCRTKTLDSFWKRRPDLLFRLNGREDCHSLIDLVQHQTSSIWLSRMTRKYVQSGTSWVACAAPNDPNEWVILGNHRDAWVFGGVDPSSGSATLMETARAFGELKRNGWKPRRTLIFASWDAEEFTLTGSTEWGELEAERLQAGALAYLNVDSSASGNSFTAAAVPALANFLREVARDVPDPSGGSIYDAWLRQTKDAKDSKDAKVSLR